jgi:hypothetical protein
LGVSEAGDTNMGKWYKVTKRINGRFYDYWQRTYRVGKSVKTENKYIGPALARNDRVLLVHKISGARQERTIRNVLPDGYAVVDDVSGVPYKATSETWDITLLKKGDPEGTSNNDDFFVELIAGASRP